MHSLHAMHLPHKTWFHCVRRHQVVATARRCWCLWFCGWPHGRGHWDAGRGIWLVWLILWAGLSWADYTVLVYLGYMPWYICCTYKQTENETSLGDSLYCWKIWSFKANHYSFEWADSNLFKSDFSSQIFLHMGIKGKAFLPREITLDLNPPPPPKYENNKFSVKFHWFLYTSNQIFLQWCFKKKLINYRKKLKISN